MAAYLLQGVPKCKQVLRGTCSTASAVDRSGQMGTCEVKQSCRYLVAQIFLSSMNLSNPSFKAVQVHGLCGSKFHSSTIQYGVWKSIFSCLYWIIQHLASLDGPGILSYERSRKAFICLFPLHLMHNFKHGGTGNVPQINIALSCICLAVLDWASQKI